MLSFWKAIYVGFRFGTDKIEVYRNPNPSQCACAVKEYFGNWCWKLPEITSQRADTKASWPKIFLNLLFCCMHDLCNNVGPNWLFELLQFFICHSYFEIRYDTIVEIVQIVILQLLQMLPWRRPNIMGPYRRGKTIATISTPYFFFKP